MKLTSVTANQHLFDGRVSGRPIRLLLSFDDGRTLRLNVGGDGEKMIVDNLPLDEPFDMDERSSFNIEDVTQSLDPRLRDADVDSVRSLQLDGKQVGVQLILERGDAFHVWVDGDDLWWGDGRALAAHDWLDGAIPSADDQGRL